MSRWLLFAEVVLLAMLIGFGAFTRDEPPISVMGEPSISVTVEVGSTHRRDHGGATPVFRSVPGR